MEQKRFTESDIKEAIRIVLQDWLDNEHGTIAQPEFINEYYKELLEWKTDQDKPLTPELLEQYNFAYNAPFYVKRPLMLSKNTVRDGSGNYDGFILRIKIEDGIQHMVFKYLHQLQNIYFALTGEELNVKL